MLVSLPTPSSFPRAPLTDEHVASPAVLNSTLSTFTSRPLSTATPSTTTSELVPASYIGEPGQVDDLSNQVRCRTFGYALQHVRKTLCKYCSHGTAGIKQLIEWRVDSGKGAKEMTSDMSESFSPLWSRLRVLFCGAFK